MSKFPFTCCPNYNAPLNELFAHRSIASRRNKLARQQFSVSDHHLVSPSTAVAHVRANNSGRRSCDSGTRGSQSPHIAIDERAEMQMKKPTLRVEQQQPRNIQRADIAPEQGYSMVVDGHFKTQFSEASAAKKTATELLTRYPMLQVEIYDAKTKARTKVQARTLAEVTE